MPKATKRGVLTKAVYYSISGVKLELGGAFSLQESIEYIANSIPLAEFDKLIEALQKQKEERLAKKNNPA